MAGAGSKKRDAKVVDKEEKKDELSKKDDENALPPLDERGNHILANIDFENPVIVHFKTDNAEATFKVSWKDVEAAVRK